ncbi:TonB-dependent receptor [Xanthomonadaceae bacterium JHOS43]|nr:TonB-dependent receptor [Xanthomonadaceae bacterium JHOS43]MCX7563973.1 TonB-dependent receptor [Xanthomonadaceae bacterium XH05]
MKRTHLSVAIGMLLGLAASAQAQAQSPGQAGTEGSEEAQRLDNVTVTARRREESIFDVPVSVSAFGESDLIEKQAVSIDGLQGAVPNLNIVQGRGSANSANVFIRGIGQPDALQTFDPGVGMYVDDIYYSRINGALFSLFDVQQVEVLRGPQGTLYGKNSTGGAIKVTTKNPFDDEGGAVELSMGNFGRAEGRVYAAGQLSDTIAASVAGAWLTHDGYVSDPVSGRKFNDDDTKALRAKLAFRPSDTFRATFAIDHTKQDAALTMGRPMAPLIRTDLALGPVVLRPASTGEFDFHSRTSFSPDQGQDLKHQGLTLAMEWDLSDSWLFKSITGHRRLDTHSFIDIDASEYELGDVLVAIDQQQTSQEFQWQFDNGSNVQSTFGLFYMKENVPSHQEAYADDLFGLAGTPIDFLRTIDDDLTSKSLAAFAHVNWEFAPTWTLAAGLRYSRDEKTYDRTTSTYWGPLFAALNETVAFDGKASWSAWTPSISVQKDFSDRVMGYVSANRGFKSGGFNGRANSAVDAANPVFDPEFVWTYEAGLKGTSADGRFRGGASVFVSDYSDFQARVSQDVGSFPVLNAAELDIKGFELEGAAFIGEATSLSAQIGWLDAEYKRFDDFRLDPTYPGFDLNVNHDHVPFSPDWTARVALNHTFSLANGSALAVGGDVSYRGKTWLSVDNRDVLSQDAYTLMGLYTVWDSPQYTWQVRAGIRNLTDEVYKIDGQEFASVGNIQTAYYGWRRNWYLSARYNF